MEKKYGVYAETTTVGTILIGEYTSEAEAVAYAERSTKETGVPHTAKTVEGRELDLYEVMAIGQ